MKVTSLIAASAIAFGFASHAANLEYTIDEPHATITFAVRHLTISTVRGSFTKASGTITTDENGDLVAAQCTIPVSSIFTKEPTRDIHLQSEDFFDEKSFPTITFKSTSVKKTGPSKYEVTGDFTMRDVTKPLVLPVELSGPIVDPWDLNRIGFESKTTINRQDWNIKYGEPMKSGGKDVSDNVDIQISVEATRSK